MIDSGLISGGSSSMSFQPTQIAETNTDVAIADTAEHTLQTITATLSNQPHFFSYSARCEINANFGGAYFSVKQDGVRIPRSGFSNMFPLGANSDQTLGCSDGFWFTPDGSSHTYTLTVQPAMVVPVSFTVHTSQLAIV